MLSRSPLCVLLLVAAAAAAAAEGPPPAWKICSPKDGDRYATTSGVVVQGTGAPGAPLTVQLVRDVKRHQEQTTTVGPNGVWTIDFPAPPAGREPSTKWKVVVVHKGREVASRDFRVELGE